LPLIEELELVPGNSRWIKEMRDLIGIRNGSPCTGGLSRQEPTDFLRRAPIQLNLCWRKPIGVMGGASSARSQSREEIANLLRGAAVEFDLGCGQDIRPIGGASCTRRGNGDETARRELFFEIRDDNDGLRVSGSYLAIAAPPAVAAIRE
jgi:hypothetical protein